MKNMVFTSVLLGALMISLSAQDVFQPDATAPVTVSVEETPSPAAEVTSSESSVTVSETAADATSTNTATVSTTTTSTLTNAPAASSLRKDKIVIEYVDQDLSAVLRGLARRAGLNLVIGPGVAGTVTIRLTDVSFEDAIKIIVGAQGLSYTKDEVLNVSYVRTAAAAVQEPTAPDSYTFNYAGAAEMVELVRRLLKSGQAPTVDVRTNRIFYNEVISNLDNVKKQIAELDMPTKQVMIEAKVMEVNTQLDQRYGLDWSSVFRGQNITAGLASTAVSALPGGNIGATALSGNINLFKPQNLQQSFALLTPSQFTATLNLFNADQDTKLLATPKLVVMDNRSATIDVNTLQNITFAVSAPAGAQTTSVAPPPFNAVAGSRLQILPRINNRNFITMRVTPTVTSFSPAPNANVGGLIVVDQQGNFQTIINPTVSTSTLETEVYIKSGNTLVIGGLSRGDTGKTTGKVPVLGDIPGIGYLFQNRTNNRRDKEVLVFVTPTVIWDPMDLRTRGIERKNTGYEPQYDELDIEKQNLYADPDGWRNNAKGAFKVIDPDSKDTLVYDENGSFTQGPPPGSKDYPAWQRKVEAEKKAKDAQKAPKPKTQGMTPTSKPAASATKTNPNNPTLATSKPTAAPKPKPEESFEAQAKRNFSASQSELSSVETITPPSPSSSTTSSAPAQKPATSLMKAGAKLAPTPIQEGPSQPPVSTGEGFVPTSDPAPTAPSETPVPASQP